MPADPRRALFDQSAAIYEEIRPVYPEAVFDDLLGYVGAERPRVLEIGPGTGQATLPLLQRGCRMTAVELGPQLASVLRKNTTDYPDIDVLTGAFEDADLPERVFDVVTVATAYHWIEQPRGLDKIARVLKPAGCLALIGLNQVNVDVRPDFFKVSQPIYERYGQGHSGPLVPREDVVPSEYSLLCQDARFEEAVLHRYRWDQTYTSEQYAKLMRTYSPMLAMEPAELERLSDELCALIDREFAGSIVRPLVVTLAMARLRLRS